MRDQGAKIESVGTAPGDGCVVSCSSAMTPLTLFGVLAVSAMLVFYAVEERAPVFVLAFAGACAASSVYGFLQGAWPFGAVEGVWTVVALRRWRRRQTVHEAAVPSAIACDISALSPEARRRYDVLRSGVVRAVRQVIATERTYRFRLDHSLSLAAAAEWLALEHRCCPFLDIALTLQHDDTTWLEIGRNKTLKEFVAEEFEAVIS